MGEPKKLWTAANAAGPEAAAPSHAASATRPTTRPTPVMRWVMDISASRGSR